jgi:hypothetical protein
LEEAATVKGPGVIEDEICRLPIVADVESRFVNQPLATLAEDDPNSQGVWSIKIAFPTFLKKFGLET